MSSDPRNRLGHAGEQLAAEHLIRLGYAITDRNYRTRFGELDIVAFGVATLVFCEVKTRRAGGSAGGAVDAVGPAKQARVRRMAAAWLVERPNRPYAEALRFDVVGVTVDAAGRLIALEHLEAAF